MKPTWIESFRKWAQSLGVQNLSGMEMMYWVRTVAMLYDRAEDAFLARWGLSGARASVLLFLYFSERWGGQSGVSPSQLCAWRGVSKGTMSVLLRNLEKDGWVVRGPDPTNRRRVLVRLTDEARNFIETHAAEHLEFLNRLAEVLSAEEREHLQTLLQKLTRGMLTLVPNARSSN